MPLDWCHPQAPHKKLRMPEWYISNLMMDRALDAIVRRVGKLACRLPRRAEGPTGVGQRVP